MLQAPAHAELHGVLAPQEHGQQAGAAHAPDLVSALPDARSVGSMSRTGSLGSQSLGSLGGVSGGSLSGWAGGGTPGGGARRPTSMRPSMEMRRRKLDTSMLQVSLSFNSDIGFKGLD